MREDIALNITNLCNFSCAHCLREGSTPDHLDLKLLQKILPQARAAGFKLAALTGGEPALHLQFEAIVAELVKQGFQFNFVTNGYQYQRYGEVIFQYRDALRNIGVSIDGAYARTMDDMRHPGSWDKAVEAVQYFVGHGFHVTSNVLLTQRNLHELESIIHQARDLGMYELWLAGLIPAAGVTDAMSLSAKDVRGVIAMSKRLSAELNFCIQYASCFLPMHELYFCNAVTMPQPTVNPYGELVFCCNTIGRGAVLGSLYEHDFHELYAQAIALGSKITQRRLYELAEGKELLYANNCEYCHRFLETSHIKHF